MPLRKLLHHLRSYRKIVGLSQEELARLLGCRYGTKISRYEQLLRTPSLRTAIAYEIIFQAPLKSLFRDLYAQVREHVQSNARALLVEVDRRAVRRKGITEFLRALGTGSTAKFRKG